MGSKIIATNPPGEARALGRICIKSFGRLCVDKCSRRRKKRQWR